MKMDLLHQGAWGKYPHFTLGHASTLQGIVPLMISHHWSPLCLLTTW